MKTNAASGAMVALLFILTGGLSSGCSNEAKLGGYLESARQYQEDGEFEKARIEYLNVLRLERTNSTALRNIGFIRHAQGVIPEALAFLVAARQVQTNDVEVRAMLADILQVGGDPKSAREEATFVVSRQSTNEEAILVLVGTAVQPEQQAATRALLAQLRQQAGEHAMFELAEGLLAMRGGDLAKAETAFQRAVALGPDRAVTHLALGNLWWRQNRLAEAEAELKKSAELAPVRSARRLRLAEFKLATGAQEEAVALLTEWHTKAPDFVPAAMMLARLALADEKHDECAQYVDKVLALDPANYDALSLRARLTLVKGESEKGREQLEKLATQYPRVPAVHDQLAVARLLNRDVEGALQSLDKATGLNPDYTDAVLLNAELSIRSGKAEAVIAGLQDFLQRQSQRGDPTNSVVVRALATAFLASGKPEEAVTAFRQAEVLAPRQPQIPLLLGSALLQQGEAAEARKSFEKTVALAPGYPPAVEQLVELDLREKQPDAALARAQAQVQLTTNAPAALFLLARVHAARNEPAPAEAVLKQVIAKEPRFSAAYMMLARMYLASQRSDEALAQLNDTLKQNTNDTGALLLAGMIYSEKGDTSKARESYEKLIAIDDRSVPGLNNLAYLLCEKTNELERAYEVARKANELAPDDPATADTFGWILVRRGEPQRALNVLKGPADRLTGEPEVQFHLGMAHYFLGQEVPARAAFERAQKIGREFPRQAEMERCLAIMGVNPSTADDQAVALIEQRLNEQADDPVALGRWVAVQGLRGTPEKAVAACEKAIKANPKLPGPMVQLAQIYADRPADRAKALELARQARALAPQDAELARTLGRVAYRSGDPKLAFSLMQDAARTLRDDPVLAHDLGVVSYSLGRVAEAELHLANAIRGDAARPETAAAKQMLEWVRLGSDPARAVAAAPQIAEWLKADPGNVPVLMAAGLVKEQQRDLPGAAVYYEEALKRSPEFTPAARNLALAYAATGGKDERVIELAGRVQVAYPDDADLAKALGVSAYRRGDHAKAAAALRQSARKKADDAAVFYYLGMAQFNLKESALSKEALQKA
ncbi:MAG: tetratricopeptide repeat protein, partial [Limisphaerales bacterium]